MITVILLLVIYKDQFTQFEKLLFFAMAFLKSFENCKTNMHMAKNGKDIKDHIIEMNLCQTQDPTVILQSKHKQFNEISSKIS